MTSKNNNSNLLTSGIFLASLLSLQALTGQSIPDVVGDGTVIPGSDAQDILCLENNGDIGFVNLDAANGFAAPSFDAATHQCSLPGLSEIILQSSANKRI